jgi:AraC-like DNA-binding protein
LARVDTRNSARFWCDPQLSGLSCLAADFTTHEYAPHSHEALVIAVTEVGGSQFKSRGRTGEAKSSVLLAFNPDEPHSGRMGRSDRWRYRGLYLTAPALEAVRQALGIETTPYFVANEFHDRDLIRSFLALHRALDLRSDALRQRELLIGGFAELFRRHGAGKVALPDIPRDRARINIVRDLMQEHYDEDLTLADMSRQVDLTPFQLIGLFNRMTGLTPHAFLTQVRLNAAIVALEAGAPIAEAALRCGFYDQSALTKHFKRCYGITPLQWVRAAQA